VARFEYDLNANANGTEGLHLMREYVVAVNPAVPAVAWQQEVGRRDVQSINQVPELHLCPTPASFVGADGPLVAVASSLSARVRVFDQRGNEAWSGDLSAPTRSSPVFANGVLLVATDAGVIHGFASSVNHAPLAPLTGFDPAAGQMVESTIPELRWAPVQDESPSALTYQVRIDSDAEVLESWKTELVTDPGQPLATVPAGLLKAGGTYVYSVRSRDGLGALSEWSTPQSFIVALTPTIELGGQEYPTLQQAIAALPGGGGTINLGRGLLRLHAPLQLPAGASLVGVSPQDTILDATGVSAGVQLTAAGRAGTPELKNLTITGADVGVQVIDVEKASLRNLVVRDNKKVGIQVEEHAGAEAVNVTLARNGAGALAQGALAIRSSLVVQNDRGLARSGTGVVTSRYNDLVANRDGNYDDVEAGPGDIASAVTFRSTADFRPAGLQPSTDRGDPGDAFALEPLPNGGRVNMGAFGNTSVAELSASTHGWSGIGGPSEGSNGTGTTPPGGGGSGCSLGGAPRPRSGAWPLLALGAFIVARRRRWR
jgi:MYXO-CTERM domain-containing protein